MPITKITARFSDKFAVYCFDPIESIPSLSSKRTNELSGVFMYVAAAIVKDQAWGEIELNIIGDRYDGQVYMLSFNPK